MYLFVLGGNGLGIILGVVFAVVIISVICLGLFFWRKSEYLYH